MPFGASTNPVQSQRSAFHHNYAMSMPEKTRPHAPLLSSLTIKDCILSMLSKGHQDFQLSNGAIGRFVYHEIITKDNFPGVYVGFALRNNNADNFTLYGRMVFTEYSFDDGKYLSGGYNIIGQIEPIDTCGELLQDRATPVFVSSGIRHGYSGIGSTLMNILKGVTEYKGYAGIRILMSMSPKSDAFYQKCGFESLGDSKWRYKSQDPDHLNLMIGEINQRSKQIDADWRPEEAPRIQMPVLSAPSMAPTRAPIMQRFTSWLLGRTEQEQSAV